MNYQTLLNEFFALKDEKYAEFSRKISGGGQKLIGVRLPLIQQKSKELIKSTTEQNKLLQDLFSFSNEYYEVVMTKLFCLSYTKIPFKEKYQWIDKAVPILDCWSNVDSFLASFKDIKKNKDDFLQQIEKFSKQEQEFSQRFALVALLFYYVEPKYFAVIESTIAVSNISKYYVHMAVAWLLAEVLVKYYDYGIIMIEKLFQQGNIDVKTHNKTIQKARESFRLNKEQKTQLNALKKTK